MRSVILNMGQTSGFRLFQNVYNSDNVIGGLILIYAHSICCVSEHVNEHGISFLTNAATKHSKYVFLTIANIKIKVYLVKIRYLLLQTAEFLMVL